MVENSDHPAWSIYDELIMAKLNVCYLEWEQRRLKMGNLATEFLIALSTSSAVASFWLLQTVWGGYFWKTLGLAATVLVIGKPIVNLTEKIRETSELLADARAIHHELHTISVLIKLYNDYNYELRQRFIKVMEYRGNLIKNYKTGTANRKKVDQCYNEILKDFPPEKFYVP